MANVLADYLVVTYDYQTVEHYVPSIVGAVIQNPEQGTHLLYRGWWCAETRKVFVGTDGRRVMVSATGRYAHATAVAIPRHESISVARIDIQTTFVTRDADLLISQCQPSNRFQAFRITPVRGRGCTLYVGSPNSDKRLRFYNKTEEAGVKPDEGEYARMELQLRDDYADRAFTALRAGNAEGHFVHLLRGMVDAFTFAVVDRSLDGVKEYHEEALASSGALERRIRWVEHSVIPALKKLFVQRPEYLDTFLTLLYDKPDSEV